ncbi:hypothetical protein [Pseudomonas abietaniphila]|uniref:hypothetical protein n=1 Tax=Pseudomonas abietaniphila TaxID=89065 RepID=UPI00128DAC3F|nr:hypothetical protein [Pseudomonas abietaniphila]
MGFLWKLQRERLLGRERKGPKFAESQRICVKTNTSMAAAHAKSAVTFVYVASRYRVEIFPTKATRKQKDNLAELKPLMAFFNGSPAAR